MHLVDALFPFYQPPQGSQPTGNKQGGSLLVLQVAGRLIRIWVTSRYLPPFSQSVFYSSIIGFAVALFLSLALFGVISLFTSASIGTLVIGLILLLVLGVTGIMLGLEVGGIFHAITKLPNNFYGICTGHSETPLGDETTPTVLTDWLSDWFNQMSGLKEDTSPPSDGLKKMKTLTFGHLKSKKLQNGQDVSITLRMITSNLSQKQPYLLPTGLKGFLFKEDEMRKLFPDDIVKHMVCYTGKNPFISKDQLPELPEGQRYYFLPDEDNLPIIVAMRMSLSFPILLSAVPLYTINALAVQRIKEGKQPKLQKDDLQPNWFSDGGISNNFPIEFFDFWLSTRPTFGISLTSLPDNALDTSSIETRSKISPEGPDSTNW